MIGIGQGEIGKAMRWPVIGAEPDSSRGRAIPVDWGRLLLVTVGVSLAYWGISWLNWALFKRGGILPMPIWPAAGFAIAVAYRFGWGAIPGLYLGALLANAVTLGSGWGLAAIIGIMNALGPWLAVHVVRLRTENRDPFQTVRDFAIFASLAVVVHPALTATGGIGGRLLLGDIAAGAFLERWQHWWLGHAAGTILFAPILLLWMAPRQESGGQDGDKGYWALSAFTVLAAAGLFRFSNAFPLGLPYLLIVPVAWVAIRHSMLRTMGLFTVVVLIGIGAIVWNPAQQIGDARTVMFPFRTMAVAYSLILLLLAIMRNTQLATEETLQTKLEELAAYRNHLEERVTERTVQLAHARDTAEAANRAKTVFLANMSHELRTPLNAILGFSETLRRDAAMSEGQRQNLEIIHRSGEHLLALINDILDMTKIEAGRVRVECAPFDLGALIGDLVDLMRVRAAEKGLDLRLDQTSSFPRFVRGDATKLRQVLVNLLGNAVKFTAQGYVVLRLRAVPESGGTRLAFEVEDSGPGIAAADRARIFDPFVQVGQPAAQKGTGLGLAITRQFVELMGGWIEVAGEPGRGSRFRVELPMEPAAESEMLPEVLGRGEVVGLEPGQPDYRILVVEDQPENTLLLSRLLVGAGFQVRTAENGSRGIELFRRWQPHFIWMDWRMPVMDGMEATRRIRALEGGHQVKIVALTASVFAEQHGEIRAAGVDDILDKPYRAQELFDCLARHLGVRYIYRERAAPDAPAPSGMTPDRVALAALPEDLRRELADALVTLDARRIDALIERVAERDAALGQFFRWHADNFDYGLIEEVLRGID